MYTCTECGKEVTTIRSYELNGRPVCRSCQLKAQHIAKYGSIEAYREAKRKATEKTCLERYGAINISQVKSIQDKKIQTSIERYGTVSPNQAQVVKDRKKDASLKKYGTEYILQAKEVREKIKNTNLKKYGVTCNLQSEETKKKLRETSLQKHGARMPLESEAIQDKASQAIQETELKKFLTDLLPDELILMHNRSILHGKELDIYLPNRKLAIEFDGLYWHDGKDNSYKYEECREQGIRLIQITEHEWKYKRSYIESILRSLFGIHEHRIFARKCEVKEISNAEYRAFTEENHLQGYSPASVRLGLFHQGELVEIESYGKSRYSKDYEWELIRECSKSGYQVVGGKSKLFKHFVREYSPSSVVSYCEKNKFSGTSYLDLGFVLDHESAPGYKYYRNGKEFSRVQFQKHKLADRLKTFDSEKTESENVKANGYFRVYDYGNFVFIWRAEQ